jgi:hypothetical protein
MRDSTIRSRLRRQIILLAPAALAASVLRAQNTTRSPKPLSLQSGDDTAARESVADPFDAHVDAPADKHARSDVRLPNGKLQTDEILKDDYAKNLKDARDLTGLARGLEEDLEKNEAFVFSLTTLRKLDDMEKLTKRIRARMKRN